MRKHKAYRPRPIRAPMIVGQAMIFGPIDQFLHQLRHSEILDYRGESMIDHPAWSELYAAAPTLHLFGKVFEAYKAESGCVIDVRPLYLLANQLKYSMPMTDASLAPVEKLFPQMQRIANTWTHQQCIQYLEVAGNEMEEPCHSST